MSRRRKVRTPLSLPEHLRPTHSFDPDPDQPDGTVDAEGQPRFRCAECGLPWNSRRHPTDGEPPTNLPPKPDGDRSDAILGEHQNEDERDLGDES